LETEGNDKAGRFLRLRDNVDNFRKNLVMSQSPEVREKIQELDEKIAQIQADLERSVFDFVITSSQRSLLTVFLVHRNLQV